MMKKNVVTIASFIILMLFSVSCNKDNKEPDEFSEHSVLGAWKVTSLDVDGHKSSFIEENESTLSMITFMKGGKLIDAYGHTANYRIDGKKIYFKGNDEDNDVHELLCEVTNFNGNKMVLTGYDEEEKRDSQATLVRIREYDPIDFSIEKLYGTWKIDLVLAEIKETALLTFGENGMFLAKSNGQNMSATYVVKGNLITIIFKDEKNNVNHTVLDVIRFSKKDMACSIKGTGIEDVMDRIRLVKQ
ncbi:hypothetical protein QYZ87_10090 [Porphyromonadaceae bacterium W3.11]|nr:hypothetical protein [Porphyromonadaceae bacterium W3.11]